MSYVGRSVPRREDRGPLSGRSRYVADLKIAGMAEVAFVRSTEAHARIAAIDTSEALALEGVVAVFTADDLAGVNAFPDFIEHIGPVAQRPLAHGKVRYVGAPYAAVVAEDRYIAEDAAALVAAGTEFEPLPIVANVDQALAPGAAKLFDDWDGNCSVDETSHGRAVDAAFAEADHSFAETYISQRQTGLPMETRGVVADSSDGMLTVWSSTQSPHIMRTTVASALGIAEASVRVLHPAVGGGFGVKTHIYPEDVAVPWIARALGRPARWIEDRLEHFVASVHAREQRHDVEVAYDDDGTIRAVRCTSLLDLGSGEIFMPGVSPVYVTNTCLSGSYDLSNFSTRTIAAVTNKTPSGAYRGYGIPESTFVMERIIDRVARLTGSDRVELRRRMLLRPSQLPYVMHGGGSIDSGSHAQCFERALELAAPALARARSKSADDPDVRVGVGYANYIEPTSPSYFRTTGHWAGGDGATVRVDPDGSVRVAAGLTAFGQGNETAAAQLAADALGVSPDDVTVVLGDTERTPYGLGSWGSRGAMMLTGSVRMASQRLMDKAREIAAHLLEASPDDLVVTDGAFGVAGSSRPTVSWAEVATAAWVRTVDLPDGMEPGLETSAHFQPANLEHERDESGRFNSAAGWSNGTHIGIVSVRISTGEVNLEDFIVVHDCGTMINPAIVEGQVHGGVAQGIAGAMYEQFQYDAETANPQFASFMDYLVPSSAEMPPMTVDHIETPAPDHPLGVKGCGEGGTVGPPAVVAGAVSDALSEWNVDITECPLTPSGVRDALRAAGAVGDAAAVNP
ncbi:xanthine dehydrogenase family protein molybdopterin-binding subunit [Candidatus Poriferisodalis sp.]|uniref:xanthine dehydrogenase family protein molybdopterin-binding subunit n=1 Tax=Candidatus Poriferisodalis sp. TaxID=3101277 RepID=UPI003B026944